MQTPTFTFKASYAPKDQAEREKAYQAELTKRIDFYIKLVSGHYEKAAAYTNIVIGAGYAAAFAIWGFVKQELTQTESIAAATLLLLSLLLFIINEVVNMISNARSMQRFSNVINLDPSQFDAEVINVTRQNQLEQIRLKRFWQLQLVATILLAVASVSFLLRGFARILIK